MRLCSLRPHRHWLRILEFSRPSNFQMSVLVCIFLGRAAGLPAPHFEAQHLKGKQSSSKTELVVSAVRGSMVHFRLFDGIQIPMDFRQYCPCLFRCCYTPFECCDYCTVSWSRLLARLPALHFQLSSMFSFSRRPTARPSRLLAAQRTLCSQ